MLFTGYNDAEQSSFCHKRYETLLKAPLEKVPQLNCVLSFLWLKTCGCWREGKSDDVKQNLPGLPGKTLLLDFCKVFRLYVENNVMLMIWRCVNAPWLLSLWIMIMCKCKKWSWKLGKNQLIIWTVVFLYTTRRNLLFIVFQKQADHLIELTFHTLGWTKIVNAVLAWVWTIRECFRHSTREDCLTKAKYYNI